MKLNLKHHSHLALKQTVLWGVTLVVMVTLLFAGLLVRLSYKPVDLSQYLPAVEELLHTQKYGGVDLDELTLNFDGDFNLIGTGVLFTGPDGQPVASALKLKLSVALRSLVFGQIGFKKVTLDGLAMRIKQTDEYIRIGSYVVQKDKQQPEQAPSKPKLSLINILSRIDDIGYLKYLEVLDIKRTMVALTLAEGHFDVWNITETDLSFTRQKGVGEKITLTGLLKPTNEDTVPFYGAFEHREGADTARMTTRFEALKSRLFTAFLPEEQRSIVSADIKSVEVDATLDNENKIKEAEIDANIGRGVLTLPEIYTEPKEFRSALVELKVEPKPASLNLTIQNLVIDAASDLLLNGAGQVQIPKEGGDVYINSRLLVMAAPLSSVMTVMPDTKMGKTMGWMRENLNYKDLIMTNLEVQLTGKLSEFPFEKVEGQTPSSLFKVAFDFDNLNLHMLDGFPDLTQAAGKFTLESDTITVASEDGGQVLDQQAKNIKGTVSELFSPDPILHATVELEGGAQSALNIIFEKEQIEPIVTDLKGTHKTLLEINTPLNGKPEEANFKATSAFQNIEVVLPFLEKPFKAENLTAHITQDTMEVQGQAELSPFEEVWWPIDFTWREQLDTFGQFTAIEGQLRTLDTPLPKVFSALGVAVNGPIANDFTFHRSGEGKPFDIYIKSNLEAAQITSSAFDWSKDKEIPGSFELLAQLAEDNGFIDIQNIALRAPGAEIMGAFYAKFDAEGRPHDMSFAFDPFIIGATNASVTYKDQNYSLIGESFNFSKIGSGELSTDMPIEDGRYTIDIKQLTFKGGRFENVLGYINRSNNMWASFDLKALVGQSRSPLTIQLIEENEKDELRRRFEVISGDAGSALRALGVYDNFSKGRLEAILNINHEYSAFGFDGDGYILIEDTHLRNAPVMARLLSLVSLQQILQADKGIAFDKIRLPLLMDNRVLRVTKGRLKGPNIGMNLEGHVDFANNNLKFNGALIPATAVNTIVKNIPLFGPLLTGTQGAIVAADFSVKGPIDNPDVSANPFSMVTPGLIKDIWGGISGGDE